MTQRIRVDPRGAVFRGLAVPFGRSAIVAERDGRVVAEQFDEHSLATMSEGIPLLVSHDRNAPPAGIVTSVGVGRSGIGIEGKLVGSDNEIEGWRRRLDAGLMGSLSIGFTARGRQQWQRPERPGAPPVVVRRGVEIFEVSLVQWPAYCDAAITSINRRTAVADESDRLKRDITVYLAETRDYLARSRRR